MSRARGTLGTVVTEATFLAHAKHGRRITVCLPARDESPTISAIVTPIVSVLRDQVGLVDEVLVMDHGSTDATARVARDAGARVVPCVSVMPQFGEPLGKGDVLWRSLFAATGDIIVWLDADLLDFTPGYVTSLVRPLLTDPEATLVRGVCQRLRDGVPGEGGRVTELTARPALRLLFPDLAHIEQPLGGEYAVRRVVAESVPFEVDYGVETGLLIDIAAAYGASSIRQVPLPPRAHRNRPLSELSVQASQVLRAALSRAGALQDGDAVVRPPVTSLTSTVRALAR